MPGRGPRAAGHACPQHRHTGPPRGSVPQAAYANRKAPACWPPRETQHAAATADSGKPTPAREADGTRRAVGVQAAERTSRESRAPVPRGLGLDSHRPGCCTDLAANFTGCCAELLVTLVSLLH